jgi:signal transduction histidine kinase/DNA-binding response OmpR family regulator/HAMP domain-containing protein
MAPPKQSSGDGLIEMLVPRGKFLTWLGRIGGRAQIIAIASLLVLGLQAGLLVYGLDRGFGILSEFLASTNRATGAVDGLAADLATVNGSIVAVMAGLLSPPDVSEFVIERPAAIARDWPTTESRLGTFVDPFTARRAQDAIDHMAGFSTRFAEALQHADRPTLERLQEDWHDLQDPLLRLINEVRARIVEQGESERLGAAALRRHISIAEGLALAIGLCVLGATWYLLIFTIARPVTRIASTMTTLAEGRLDTRIPGRERRDEIGEMASAIEVFRSHATERDALLRERADAATRLERLVEERTAELKQHGAMLDATFDNMAQGILMVDRDLRILVHNERFVELWGLTADVLRTHPSMPALLRYGAERGDFGSAAPYDVVMERLAAVGAGRTVQGEARLSSGLVLEIRGVPLIDGGYVFTYTDVTEQRQAQDDIRIAKDAAEAANSAKSSFLATMTHELRTPMNGVLGILELLHQTDLDAEQRELIDVIGGSAEALLKIIDDILDLSKIEAGKMEIERLPLAPLPLIEGVADTLAPHAHRKKLSFKTYVDQTVPAALIGDPVRLRQILFNLIGNAIKFTEQGSVSVQLTTEGPSQLRLNVTDTGIGLDESARARLFKPFSQADGTTTRRFGGTGLGLSICRRLVELMGGTIGVDSAPGRGSTFWVQLPLEPSEIPAAPLLDDLTGLRILIVEDDPITSWLLTRYLTSAGAAVETAPSAESALRRVAARPQDVDVAVVDLKLPGRDGFEFHLEMMEDPRLKNVKAVLLTAYNDPAHRRRALAANFTAYLTKPVRKATLIHAIAVAAGRAAAPGAVERRPPAAARPDAPAGGARGRILVAEDHETNRIVITRQLASLGYQVDVVGDGRAALEALDGGPPFDLLLTDCFMPEMDGYELAQAVRERERLSASTRMPIVALTAATLRGEAERCFAAGMDDYLPKPVKLAQLDETLRRWIHGETVRSSTGVPASSPVSTRPPAFDLNELREVLGTFDERTHAFMRQFVDATPPLIDRIRQAVVARDRQEAQRTGHTAKGAARSVMAVELAELFAAVERSATDEDWPAAEARLADLVPALQRARDFVAKV